MYTGEIRRYKPLTLAEDRMFGTSSDFKEHYKKNLVDEEGIIKIGDNTIRTSPKAMAVLKALLFTGCCYIEDRASACRQIFVDACTSGLYIDVGDILNSACIDSKNPFTQVLMDTIKEVVEDE